MGCARLAAVAAIALALSGCYTLLRHPGIARMNYRRPAPEESCRSCHSGNEILSAITPERYVPEPGAWGDLAHPWWIQPPDTTRSDGGSGE